MKDLLMSQMGFWTAFTIIFIFGVMVWFIYKLNKLSKLPPQKADD